MKKGPGKTPPDHDVINGFDNSSNPRRSGQLLAPFWAVPYRMLKDMARTGAGIVQPAAADRHSTVRKHLTDVRSELRRDFDRIIRGLPDLSGGDNEPAERAFQLL